MATKIPEPVSTQVNQQDIVHPHGSTQANMANNLSYLQQQQQESSKYDNEVEQFTLLHKFKISKLHLLILILIILLMVLLYLKN